MFPSVTLARTAVLALRNTPRIAATFNGRSRFSASVLLTQPNTAAVAAFSTDAKSPDDLSKQKSEAEKQLDQLLDDELAFLDESGESDQRLAASDILGTDEDNQMESSSEVEAQLFEDEYKDIIDMSDPPMLTMDHYRMLKRLDFDRWDPDYFFDEDEAIEEGTNLPVPKPGDATKKHTLTKRQMSGTLDDFRSKFPQDFFGDENAVQVKPPKKNTCVFCRPDNTPEQRYKLEYTNINLLLQFVNERGMITRRTENHNCAKHQRKIAKLIKRSRVSGLMAYTSDWHVPVEFLQATNQLDPRVYAEAEGDAEEADEGESMEQMELEMEQDEHADESEDPFINHSIPVKINAEQSKQS